MWSKSSLLAHCDEVSSVTTPGLKATRTQRHRQKATGQKATASRGVFSGAYLNTFEYGNCKLTGIRKKITHLYSSEILHKQHLTIHTTSKAKKCAQRWSSSVSGISSIIDKAAPQVACLMLNVLILCLCHVTSVLFSTQTKRMVWPSPRRASATDLLPSLHATHRFCRRSCNSHVARLTRFLGGCPRASASRAMWTRAVSFLRLSSKPYRDGWLWPICRANAWFKQLGPTKPPRELSCMVVRPALMQLRLSLLSWCACELNFWSAVMPQHRVNVVIIVHSGISPFCLQRLITGRVAFCPVAFCPGGL